MTRLIFTIAAIVTAAAAELGHTSPQMLYAHYREVVHEEEAKRYWNVFPPAEANIVGFVADQP
jgi:hypothetical protein